MCRRLKNNRRLADFLIAINRQVFSLPQDEKSGNKHLSKIKTFADDRGKSISKMILIVEKYDYIRELMRSWIEMYGYRVIEATNGAEAVECVRNESPHLVLMAINLPVMDGITATKQIRNLENGKDIPVLAIASSGTLHERALQAGYNNVFDKPIDFEKVLQAISNYLPI